MKVALLGTRGIPRAARGFETAVQFIGPGPGRPWVGCDRLLPQPRAETCEFEGTRLVNLPACA